AGRRRASPCVPVRPGRPGATGREAAPAAACPCAVAAGSGAGTRGPRAAAGPVPAAPTSRVPAATRKPAAGRWSVAAGPAGSWALACLGSAQLLAQLLDQILRGGQRQQRHADLLRQALPARAALLGLARVGAAQVGVTGVQLQLRAPLAEAQQAGV